MNKISKRYEFVRKELIKRLEAMKRNNIWLVKYLSNGNLVQKLFENEEEKEGFFGNNIIAKQWLKIYFGKDSELDGWGREWVDPYCSGSDDNFNYDGFVLLIIKDTAKQLLMNCRTYRFNIGSCNNDEWYGWPYDIIKELTE